MKITNETNLTQQATQFTDGEHGSATQTYEIFSDDLRLGVKMVVARGSANQGFTRSFFADGKEYAEFELAAVAAGHEWARDS